MEIGPSAFVRKASIVCERKFIGVSVSNIHFNISFLVREKMVSPDLREIWASKEIG